MGCLLSTYGIARDTAGDSTRLLEELSRLAADGLTLRAGPVVIQRGEVRRLATVALGARALRPVAANRDSSTAGARGTGSRVHVLNGEWKGTRKQSGRSELDCFRACRARSHHDVPSTCLLALLWCVRTWANVLISQVLHVPSVSGICPAVQPVQVVVCSKAPRFRPDSQETHALCPDAVRSSLLLAAHCEQPVLVAPLEYQSSWGVAPSVKVAHASHAVATFELE